MMMMMMLMMLMQMMMMIICVWHVTPGRPCHTLSQGARVTCYLQASVSHGSGEEVDRIGRSHGSLRRRRMRASPSEPTSRLQRSSQGLLGLILEQSIESLNQVIRWAPPR